MSGVGAGAKDVSVVVRIPTPLRAFVGGEAEVRVRGTTVRGVLEGLADRYEGIRGSILDADGSRRRFVNVFLGERSLRTDEDLDARVAEGDVIAVLPAVAGGRAAKDRRLAELRAEIPEVTPEEALALQRAGALLVDVREADEVAAGTPLGARWLVRGYLELRIEEHAEDFDTPLVLMCAGGVRSLLAADDLRRLGYTDVRSMEGGFARWKSDGLPVEVPETLGASERERYGRHVLIPEVGEAGQLALRRSRVLMIGAGGLGSPAAFYLAAAGVGTLGIIDDDVVDRSNLQRQILHTDDRVGTPKVDSARERLLALNPDIEVNTFAERLTSENAERLMAGYDVIVDGSDNFATRYLVNDVSVRFGTPNVHGSIYRFEGQVSVFWPGAESPGPCYRCLYPEPPPPELAPSCAEAGVLGVLPGVIGTLEAVETVKLLLGVGEPLVGKLLHYDALTASFSTFRVERDPACDWCGDHVASAPALIDYEAFCAVGAAWVGRSRR
ncbi:MAG: molybdopterin-synthase adenylyltransferase MoeB, partial [Gemmatimonadota bacterium]|nr:molybdopterin-synthase adenylyltransferase MoeB [Gemmatimonadota bacterium]